MTADKTKSLAGRVLATSDDPEAKSLAAHVLSDDYGNTASDRMVEMQAAQPEPQPGPPLTKEYLQRLLRKISGQEGQTERADAVRAVIGGMG